MLRLQTLVILFHLYVGWRLVPDLAVFGLPVAASFAVWLVLSAVLLPQGLFARRARHQALSDALVWSGSIAMGSFSSLFVLTFLRDAGLLVAGVIDYLVPNSFSMRELHEWSAVAVPLLAALLTLIGFLNARRRAVVRSVEVSI